MLIANPAVGRVELDLSFTSEGAFSCRVTQRKNYVPRMPFAAAMPRSTSVALASVCIHDVSAAYLRLSHRPEPERRRDTYEPLCWHSTN